jgi:uncharacterized protein YndB with AHSA1/START domain
MTDDHRNGTVDINGDQATMTFRRRLPHSIDVVWAAITDPLQRRAWFGETTIEPRAGGAIEMMPDSPPAPPEAKHMSGRILVWDPPRPLVESDAPRSAVFEHEWRQRIVEESVVRYQLTEDGDSTILTFSHRGMSIGNAQGFMPGEHAFIDRLEACLDEVEIPDWGQRYAAVAPVYTDAFSGHQAAGTGSR